MWPAKQMVVSAQIAMCLGLAHYDIFSGFEEPDPGHFEVNSTSTLPSETAEKTTSSASTEFNNVELMMSKAVPNVTNTSTTAATTNISEDSILTLLSTEPGTTKRKARKRRYRLGRPTQILTKSSCPEAERPSNIGAYEVPTQSDMVSYAKSTMRRMFKRYHLKVTILLDDIEQATRASSELEGMCKSPAVYRKCVRNVDTLSKVVAKSYLASVEMMRHDVNQLSEDSICKLSSMKEDPVKVIESLAMQDASLDFALPGFLRLLNTCSIYCSAATAFAKREKVFLSISEDPAITRFLNPKLYTRITS